MTPALDIILAEICRTGVTNYPWQKLRPVISFKLTSMLTQFYETHNKDEEIAGERFSDVRERLASALEQFDGPPFTLQRMCELITADGSPDKPPCHYKKTHKLTAALDKLVSVTSLLRPIRVDEVETEPTPMDATKPTESVALDPPAPIAESA